MGLRSDEGERGDRGENGLMRRMEERSDQV
jgi:hypothetical protein